MAQDLLQAGIAKYINSLEVPHFRKPRNSKPKALTVPSQPDSSHSSGVLEAELRSLRKLVDDQARKLLEDFAKDVQLNLDALFRVVVNFLSQPEPEGLDMPKINSILTAIQDAFKDKYKEYFSSEPDSLTEVFFSLQDTLEEMKLQSKQLGDKIFKLKSTPELGVHNPADLSTSASSTIPVPPTLNNLKVEDPPKSEKSKKDDNKAAGGAGLITKITGFFKRDETYAKTDLGKDSSSMRWIFDDDPQEEEEQVVKLPPKAQDIAKKKAEEEKKKEEETEDKPDANKPAGNPISSLVKPRERNFDRSKAKSKAAPGSLVKGPKMAVRLVLDEPAAAQQLTFSEQQDQIHSTIRAAFQTALKEQTDFINGYLIEATAKVEQGEEMDQEIQEFEHTVKAFIAKTALDAVACTFQSMRSQIVSCSNSSETNHKHHHIFCKSVQTDWCPSSDSPVNSSKLVQLESEKAQIFQTLASEREYFEKTESQLNEQIHRLLEHSTTVQDSLLEALEGAIDTRSANDRASRAIGETKVLEYAEILSLIEFAHATWEKLKESQQQQEMLSRQVGALTDTLEQAAAYITALKVQVFELTEKISESDDFGADLQRKICQASQENSLLKEMVQLLLQQVIRTRIESNNLIEEISHIHQNYAQESHLSAAHIDYLTQALYKAKEAISRSIDADNLAFESIKQQHNQRAAILAAGSSRYDDALVSIQRERENFSQQLANLEAYINQLEAALEHSRTQAQLEQEKNLAIHQTYEELEARFSEIELQKQGYEVQWVAIWDWLRSKLTDETIKHDSVLDSLEAFTEQVRSQALEEFQILKNQEIEHIKTALELQIAHLTSEIDSKTQQAERLQQEQSTERYIADQRHREEISDLRAALTAEVQLLKIELEKGSGVGESQEELVAVKSQNRQLSEEIARLSQERGILDSELVQLKSGWQEKEELWGKELQSFKDSNQVAQEKIDLLCQELRELQEKAGRPNEMLESELAKAYEELGVLREQGEKQGQRLQVLEEEHETLRESWEGLQQDKVIVESQLVVVQTERDELVHQMKVLKESQSAGNPEVNNLLLSVPKAEKEDKEIQSDLEVIESDVEEGSNSKGGQLSSSPVDVGVSVEQLNELVESLRVQLAEAEGKILKLESAKGEEAEVVVVEGKSTSQPKSNSGEDNDEFVKMGLDRSISGGERARVEAELEELRERVEEQENRIKLLLLDLGEANQSLKSAEQEKNSLTQRFLQEISLAAQTNGAAAREFLKTIQPLR